MTEMAPETPPEPGTPGFLAHVRAWFERDIAPEIGAVRGDLSRVLAFAEAHAANAQQIAGLVLALARAADPAAAPEVAALVTGAEKALAEAEKIAGELLGRM